LELKIHTNFGCTARLATLDKLVDRFPLPPIAPPIGDTSLTHVMRLAARLLRSYCIKRNAMRTNRQNWRFNDVFFFSHSYKFLNFGNFLIGFLKHIFELLYYNTKNIISGAHGNITCYDCWRNHCYRDEIQQKTCTEEGDVCLSFFIPGEFCFVAE
jgi:hypothetical protein